MSVFVAEDPKSTLFLLDSPNAIGAFFRGLIDASGDSGRLCKSIASSPVTERRATGIESFFPKLLESPNEEECESIVVNGFC